MSATAEMTDRAIAQGKTFVWHQLFAPSEQTSLDFYTQALDWGTAEMPMGEGGAYKMLVANGVPVAGVIGTAGNECCDGIPPHWSVCIGVDDVDARVARVQALGGKLLQGPMDIPDVGRTALVQDPQGASFWLFQPEM